MAHCFFQYTFSATAVAIVKSALHERSSMTAYFTCIVLLSGLSPAKNKIKSIIIQVTFVLIFKYLFKKKKELPIQSWVIGPGVRLDGYLTWVIVILRVAV